MKSKIMTAIGATSLVFGIFALQGCYESNYPDYGGYGYGSGPAYYSAPVVVGDYDEHRSWHHWWGGNHRDRDDDHHYRDRDHDRD